ncbi:MAG: TonB-dependent receptor [Spongiibacteraceae bacterium]
MLKNINNSQRKKLPFYMWAIGLGIGSLLTVSEANAKYTLEEVVVTATKKASAESAQDVGIAITAVSGDAIENRFFKDLTDVANLAPNVQMAAAGTTPGTPSFFIRGMGLFSSIPSDEPAVGIIQDGIYLGVTAGSLTNLFDVESVEVLRGPQGTLFGRNVTGGAVVVNNRRPTEDTSGRISARVGSNGLYQLNGAIGGSLNDAQNVLGKITLGTQSNGDYFDNIAGPDRGEADAFYVRPIITIKPNDDLEITFIGEYNDFEGDGVVSAAQTQPNGLVLKDHQVSMNFDNQAEYQVKHLIADVDWEIGPGNLRVISGWRDVLVKGQIDADGTAVSFFHSAAPWVIDQEQLSTEVRYAMPLSDTAELTLGLYYFEQEIIYSESRDILDGAVLVGGGGVIDHNSLGAFAQTSVDLTDTLNLTVGARYTSEDKDAKIGSFGSCDAAGKNCNYDFKDGDSWSSVSGHVALKWAFMDDAHMYTSWTRSFRSGGYNLRNAQPSLPGPYDDEQVDAYEIGLKSDWLDKNLRLNIAAFYNEYSDLQRTIAFSDPALGSRQEKRNVADAVIQGFEIELTSFFSEDFRMELAYGYTNAEFKKSHANTPGISSLDFTTVDFANVPEVNGNITLAYNLPLAEGSLEFMSSTTYTDEQFSSDDNEISIDAYTVTDLSGTYTFPNQNLRLAAYIKNATDEAYSYFATPVGSYKVNWSLGLPRNYGLELSYSF